MRSFVLPLPMLLVVLFAGSPATADIILPGIDARVSQGAWRVLSTTGTVPAITLSYRELTADIGASFLVRGGLFDEPFTLAGAVDGEDWALTISLTGQRNVRDVAGRLVEDGLRMVLTVQHVAALYPGQPLPGPVITVIAQFFSIPYPGLQPTQHATGVPSAPHGPGRADTVGYNGYGVSRDGRLIAWELNAAEISDMPEPSTLVLLGLGLATGAGLRRRR